MGKTEKNKKYSTEFKISVIMVFYSENFESTRGFIEKLEEYLHYYNNERISLNLKGVSPVQFRTHSYSLILFCLNFGVHFIPL